MSQLFSFQGRILLGERLENGKPGKLEWVGNAPSCTLSIATENAEKIESFSGQRLPYGRIQTSKKATIKLNLDEILPTNLVQGLYSTQVKTEGGAITSELLPAGLESGDIIRLDNPFIDEESLIIKDSAANPITVDKTKFIVESVSAGLLKIVNTAGLVQPLKASYHFTKRSAFTILSQTPPERYFVLDGVNTENNQPIVLSLYRVRFDPAESLDLINSEYGSLSLSGSALLDTVNVNDPALGGFGKLELKAA
ncbi:hypothetical protein DES39_0350 [Orbus hercynius]|uniref:Uncharacterized protein n=1 Tax=Orbus hercynius TaxID=593135 RepID=A0A495RI86_9GAMM|nr:hypothetical protein [Orbus hercynius]RKS87135.1 hypothetical protein DES39_0350 [Orbus hercynius]